MKAIQVHEFGGPEVLKLEEIPTPKPGAGQVLVKVHAAGVNPYDPYMRTGTYAIKPPLPYTPGSDAAGVVDSVGTGVTKVKAGDRVYTAKTISGAYAAYTLAQDGLQLTDTGEAREKLAAVRQTYEPYIYALSSYLNQTLPPWIPQGKGKDNWQTTAWGETSGLVEKKAETVGVDEHF